MIQIGANRINSVYSPLPNAVLPTASDWKSCLPFACQSFRNRGPVSTIIESDPFEPKLLAAVSSTGNIKFALLLLTKIGFCQYLTSIRVLISFVDNDGFSETCLITFLCKNIKSTVICSYFPSYKIPQRFLTPDTLPLSTLALVTMFSATLLLALLTAHSTLIAPSPSPATGGSIQQPSADVQPQGGSNAITANPLYVITSAYIHQYDGPPTAGTKIKARQAIDAQPVTNNTLPAANDNPSDYSTNSGPAMPRPSKMENFNLTVASGAGHSPGVHCNLTWDAGTANSATRDHIANETFSCDDGQTKVRMERRNVTPQYGFYVFVQMP